MLNGNLLRAINYNRLEDETSYGNNETNDIYAIDWQKGIGAVMVADVHFVSFFYTL